MNAKNCGYVAGAVLMACSALVLAQTFGVKQRTPRPDEYGNVVIDNYSTSTNVAPVVFSHWLHRAKFTCRLCHVDLGFAMTAGGTAIREEDNLDGLYCGACHNGKMAFGAVERTAAGGSKESCTLCHSLGEQVDFKHKFRDLVRDFPRARFGNRVDWMRAEDEGLIELTDYLEGISIHRRALQDPIDSEIEPKVHEMPDIVFSHKKHAVWNGCELCHPQIFAVKKGLTVYEMQDIFDGRFCGACHGKVAFPNLDCQLCHTKEVY